MPRSASRPLRRISVLGSGKIGEDTVAYAQALKLGEALAQEGFSVYHGGYRGVMEAVAKGSRLAGGRNIAVTIQRKPIREPGSSMGGRKSKDRGLNPVNPWADAEVGMPSWKERLFKLIEIGDAYIFLDGATGTLNELFFVLEMTNRGLLRNPVIILGKKLGVLVRSLSKDPHFDLPKQLVFASSIPQTLKLLIGYRG